jgi:uncharacterized protein (TIGR00297 family)
VGIERVDVVDHFDRRRVSGDNSRMNLLQLLAGFLLAIIIAYAAYRAHSLNQSGAYAAVIVGTLIFGVGGWQWAVLLLTFFITSSGLTRAFKKRKLDLAEKFSKGGQRDAGQVFGNGALAAIFAALSPFAGSWTWIAFAASLAAVNADTWATELGVLNPHPPRMITNGKVVEKGTSGGVSLIGTLASLAGAGVIAILAAWLSPFGTDWSLIWIISLAGLLGSLFDSFLGATAQAIYHCPSCHKETERHPTHLCGSPTTLKRGWAWLNNDLVNFGCALFAVIAALAL